MSMSAYRGGEGRVPTGREGVSTHRRRHVHTQVRSGVCVTERGACQQIGEGVPTHRWIVNMCFIRMHTALDCAVCGRACVCDSVNMPVSCALYVMVIDDLAIVSAKLSCNSTKIQSRV